jgi:alpha-beta hydrolase superfamily lysophospholipase
VGIWGLSYGGLLTSQALARTPTSSSPGADLAGVHLYGSSLDTASMSYKSSAISAIDSWKSPVFLVHGDDDRNVDFRPDGGPGAAPARAGHLLRARGRPGRPARVNAAPELGRARSAHGRVPASVRVEKESAAATNGK